DAARWCAQYSGEVALSSRKVVRLLLDAGADYDIRSATYLADAERVRVLLSKDPSEAKSKALMRIAAMHGRSAIVKLLLQNKADPDDADWNGLPQLYFAIEHPEVVRLLLEAGADAKGPLKGTGGPGIPTEESKITLLHWAAKTGPVETAKLLLE